MNKSFILLIFLVVLSACTADQYEPSPKCISDTSYQDVKGIIDASCNGSGCHDGASGVGDYRSFRGLESDLLDGKFYEVLFVTQSMPPSGFSISTSDLEALKCWADNNFATE